MNARVIDPKSLDPEEFLASWYGPRDDIMETVESDLALLPDGLRKWLHLISRWKFPLSMNKTLFLSSDMAEENGKYIFMGDQGGWAWAFDPNTPLTVYEAKDDEPWRPLRGEWADMFFYHAFTEAIEAAPVVKWCADISERDLRRVLRGFDEIAFNDSRWPAPEWRWYVTEGLVADAGPRKGSPGRFVITVGAKSKEIAERLDLPNNVDWRVRENR